MKAAEELAGFGHERTELIGEVTDDIDVRRIIGEHDQVEGWRVGRADLSLSVVEAHDNRCVDEPFHRYRMERHLAFRGTRSRQGGGRGPLGGRPQVC